MTIQYLVMVYLMENLKVNVKIKGHFENNVPLDVFAFVIRGYYGWCHSGWKVFDLMLLMLQEEVEVSRICMGFFWTAQ